MNIKLVPGDVIHESSIKTVQQNNEILLVNLPSIPERNTETKL